MLEDHTTLDVRHYEVNPEEILENVVHIDQERMIHRPENVLLHGYVGQLVMLDDQVLPDAFHGEQLPSVDVLYQVHFAKSTCSNEF